MFYLSPPVSPYMIIDQVIEKDVNPQFWTELSGWDEQEDKLIPRGHSQTKNVSDEITLAVTIPTEWKANSVTWKTDLWKSHFCYAFGFLFMQSSSLEHSNWDI